MKNLSVFFIVLITMFLASCTDTSLKPEEAERLIKERLSKMPGRSVSFYLGAMTDPAYLPVYKKIATGRYLTLKEDVFVEAAGKKMPMFEATPEGEKIFKCDNNRCSVEVCKTEFDKFVSIVNKGKFANSTYQVKTICDGEIYNIFRPLADRQYIKPETVEEKAEFEYSKDTWIIK
ncbi:MAG TPA: hypothetical protein PLX56_08245 [bacterium]|jgi:hypothetical protein|nr:hypothetical protein [bacterium]HQI04867.1 hypothetical protein [bacterium]HQN74223.1 hypothetical protein [bacterium]HQO92302.1 hypothetical protein [bacterium]